MKHRAIPIVYVAPLILIGLLVGGCTDTEQRLFETQSAIIRATAAAVAKTEGAKAWETSQALVATEVPSVFGTLLAVSKTEIPIVLGTLIAGWEEGSFSVPASGYLGLTYREPYGDDRGLHPGVDIWATRHTGIVWPDDSVKHGNPVYAVYDGKLGRTGSGVEICHPPLDADRWPDLPAYNVCTYYGHLKDLPERFASLPKDTCPRGLVDVKKGDLLGYMDHDTQSNIVHLHFSVARKNINNGCWMDERVLGNTYNPFIYLGIDDSIYDWLDEFP